MVLFSLITIYLFHIHYKATHGYHLNDNDETVATNITNITDTYIAFVTQWRPQACYNSNAPNCINASITSNITIHGEWPDFYSSTNYPTFCTKQTLQESDIEPIKSQMALLWPTYSSSWTDFKFWSHEWSKHGTCWFTEKNPLAFFKQGLLYFNKYDVESVFTDGNIVPGNTYYKYNDIDKMLETAFGQRCVIGCENGKYIASFQVCVDWNGNGVDCPQTMTTNCDTEVILSDGR